MADQTNDGVQNESREEIERNLEEDERAERREAERMLAAIRTIREQELDCSNHGGSWAVSREGVVGFGESPAEALHHYHRARDGKPYHPYPGHSFSVHDMPYIERMKWIQTMCKHEVADLEQELAELRSLQASEAVRITERDLCDVDLECTADDQSLVMTIATFRQFLELYESPQTRKARRERLEAAFPGPRQYSGPDDSIGLPRYYRIDRRTYENAEGEPRAEWYPGAFDPADRESIGFCSYSSPEGAAAECRRHAEHVRGDTTGVQLTPQWSASTIEAFWYRWCENRDGDSTKLTIADFVRDLCAAVKT